jgi:hypothetical protein
MGQGIGGEDGEIVNKENVTDVIIVLDTQRLVNQTIENCN